MCVKDDEREEHDVFCARACTGPGSSVLG